MKKAYPERNVLLLSATPHTLYRDLTLTLSPLIWIGYDSKWCGLPELKPEKAKDLCWSFTQA